jgi:hypothetical protein
MSLQFHCALGGMEVWSATSGGLSFVITYASPTGTGFRGRPGYVASWRPLYVSRTAIRIAGSPFQTFADAEEACNAMRDHLKYVPKIPIYAGKVEARVGPIILPRAMPFRWAADADDAHISFAEG